MSETTELNRIRRVMLELNKCDPILLSQLGEMGKNLLAARAVVAAGPVVRKPRKSSKA